MSDKYAEQAQNLYDEIKHGLRVARALDKIAAALRQAAADATRAERERCAKIAEDWTNKRLYGALRSDTAQKIAAAIRAEPDTGDAEKGEG